MPTNPLPGHRHPDGSRELAPHVWQHPDRLSGAPPYIAREALAPDGGDGDATD